MSNFRHGGGGTRLYKCWKGMRGRVKARDDCNLHPEWEDFVAFRAWAMDNGYTDELILCRNGDTGDYAPDNARWDTSANNTIEHRAKHFKFCFEDELVEIYNLEKFCRENNLSSGHMNAVHKGKRKTHKGYSRWLKQSQSA